MRLQKHNSVPFLKLLLVPLAWSVSAHGATKVWSGATAGATWSTGTNWVGGTAPSGSISTSTGDFAQFSSTTSGRMPNVSGTRGINGMTFSGRDWQLTNSVSDGILSVGGNGITVESGRTVNLNTLISVNGQSWTTTGTGILNVNQAVTEVAGGPFTLTKAGSGTLNLNANVSVGTLSLTGGLTVLGADNLLADTATLSISNGTLDLQGTDTVASLTSTGGTITLGSGKTLTVAGNSSIGSGSTITGGTLKASGGTLTFNSTSGNTSAVTIDAGAKLSGTGAVGGATTIAASGRLAPTAQASGSKLTFGSTLGFTAGSIFEWDLNAATSDPGANTPNSGTYGQVSASGAATGTSVFNIVLGTNTYADAFWNTNKSWNDVFAASGLTDSNTLFTTFSGSGLTSTGIGPTAIATASGEGHFSFSGTTLNWTAVPEPTSALSGLLIAAGLLRRRRK